MADNEKFVEGVAKEKIEKRIENYNNILSSDSIDKNSSEYIKAQDVIEEIIDLLKKSKPEYTFLESSEIEKRIEEYFNDLKYIDRDYLSNKQKSLERNLGELESSSSSSVEEKEQTVDELLEEIQRLSEMDVVPPTLEEIQAWKSMRASLGSKDQKALENELEEIRRAITELDGRDPLDVELQKRVVKNRIDELGDINKEKELYKITDKGEMVINYPDVSYEIDEEAVKAEYEARRQDMLDKFYGNRARGKEYSIAMQALKSHIVAKEFEYKDKAGKTVKGVYQTVEDYSGRAEDLKFMQLEEYVERLERLTKAEAGDLSVYKEVYVRDEEGKFVKLSPKEAREADEQYIDSNNNAYNKLVYTRENLKTLGKYGEKVPYSEFQKHQVVRNIFRAVGNAGKFVRNHITAPVNKFIGSKIVSPIYGKVTGADDKVAGLYGNKATHRYVARREYFESQGKGFFASRFNSIFKAKEGNKAVLSSGAYDIQQSIMKKYTEIAQQKAFEKKTEFASKSIDEKIAMIQEDLQKATGDKDKAKLTSTLEELAKAKLQIAKDKALNEKAATAQTIQTDAIDISQHDIANKENVTRTITGVKMLSRLGIRKLVGPKIKEWMLKHTTKTQSVTTEATQSQIEEALGIRDKKWIDTTYKEEIVPITETQLNTDASMAEMMTSNAGKQIEGYYSVYGGEVKPAIYDLTGKEKITAIFKQAENGGFGLSDTAGLKAPTLTDGTFASELLEANGTLRQDITLDQILKAVESSTVTPEELSGIYVAVGDRYWTKLSDLCKDITREVQVDSTMEKVVDVPGHFVSLTPAEKMQELKEALKDPINAAKVNVLKTATTETVENTRVTNVLRDLGIAFNGVDGTLIADDVYENVRRTGTDIAWQKPTEANYDSDTAFTGKRKTDMQRTKKRQESRDER